MKIKSVISNESIEREHSGTEREILEDVQKLVSDSDYIDTSDKQGITTMLEFMLQGKTVYEEQELIDTLNHVSQENGEPMRFFN